MVYETSAVNGAAETMHIHACSEAKDYIEFDADRMRTIVPDAECEPGTTGGGDWSAEGDVITTNFLDPVADNLRKYRVLKLNARELVMRVQYEEEGATITEVGSFTRS